MSSKKLKNRTITNIIYITLIVIILFSNFFTKHLSHFLRLRPNIPDMLTTQIHFIDVGQGDAIAINFSNGKTMLVDSGVIGYRDKLTRYLNNIVLKDNKTIDYLVLTHTDSDHMSNMQYIVENYQIGTFYRPAIYLPEENKEPVDNSDDYRNLLNVLNLKNINTKFNDISNNIIDNSISIKWLYPDINDLYDYDNERYNNLSCVLLIEDNDNKLLLTGDVDSTIETSLINIYGEELLDIDVLKLAHHGSNYSTSELFLETTSPKCLVASVGDNTYNHPGSDVVSRILNYDSNHDTDLFGNFYITKDHGNIIIDLNQDLSTHFIDNIDNYSFVPYYVYTIIAVVFLLYFLFIPYILDYITTMKKYRYNKKYRLEKLKNKNKYNKTS